MSSRLSPGVVPDRYQIQTFHDRVDLHAALELGDDQHRHDLSITLGHPRNNTVFGTKLRVQRLERRKSPRDSEFKWNFRGFSIGPCGMIAVEGKLTNDPKSYFAAQRSDNWLCVMPRMHCTTCGYYQELPARKKYCDECGTRLEIVTLYPLID